ncbi:MAG TPA: ABC transporter substrate-binding protein [Cytophagaceae bacterium]|jgi:iron complex transport system substrate-binding protein|nr:ABC transporter substrate-binding protein [Cytophagaceae bacterium]
MKVCSFLPAVTQMIYSMNLQEHLSGVTFECISDKPKVVRSYIEGNDYTSEEIDRIVSQSKAQGKSLYYIDEELLQSISPDIIFTQDVCDVCQIDTSYVQRSTYKLKKQPLIVSLIPKTLNDVYQNAITIATALGKEEVAYKYLAELKKRTDGIIDTLRKYNAPLRRVMVMEWIDPIYNCGHWIPYQVAQAGGVDMLSNPSGYSIVTPWEKVRLYNPEVLVVAPCGFNVNRAAKEIEILYSKEGWNDLGAVKNREVYIVDAEFFTQPSTTLVDGIELLAALFHPTLFQVPQKLSTHYLSIEKMSVVK